MFLFDHEQNFIGATGYHHVNWNIPSFEIGYWIKTSCAGKGLMTEAVNALTRYAFEQLKAKRVEIRCDTTNKKSKKIPERLGYELEGTLRFSRIAPTDGVSDTVIFARYDTARLPELNVTW